MQIKLNKLQTNKKNNIKRCFALFLVGHYGKLKWSHPLCSNIIVNVTYAFQTHKPFHVAKLGGSYNGKLRNRSDIRFRLLAYTYTIII